MRLNIFLGLRIARRLAVVGAINGLGYIPADIITVRKYRSPDSHQSYVNQRLQLVESRRPGSA